MAPFPFPEFPTYQRYADWLEERGFRVEFGGNEWDRFMFAVLPDSSVHIFERALEPDAPLVPSAVERMDSRLGVTSPWNPRSKTQQEAAED